MIAFWAVPYFLAAIAGHALLVRMGRPGNVFVRFLASGLPVGVVLMWHMFTLYGWGVAPWAAVALYAVSCELYMFLLSLVTTSVSVRLLLALRRGELSRAEIDALYDTAGMVSRRLENLVATGLLERDAVGYHLSVRGRRVVWAFAVLKRFFRHDQLAGQHLSPATVRPEKGAA
jgi:hypothetical protein